MIAPLPGIFAFVLPMVVIVSCHYFKSMHAFVFKMHNELSTITIVALYGQVCFAHQLMCYCSFNAFFDGNK